MINTGSQGAMAVTFLAMPGDCYQHRFGGLRFRAQPTRQLVPIHFGQPDTEQADLRRCAPCSTST